MCMSGRGRYDRVRSCGNTEAIADVPAIERIELFGRVSELTEKHADLFTRSLCAESGELVSKARSEVDATIKRMKLVAEGSAQGDHAVR